METGKININEELETNTQRLQRRNKTVFGKSEGEMKEAHGEERIQAASPLHLHGSLLCKMEELTALAKSQREYRECSLLCFTQTRLHQIVPHENVSVDDFETIRVDWSCSESVKRELEAEAAALAEKEKGAAAEGSKVKDPACFSVSGVYFTCPLTGARLTKCQREVHIKEAILMHFEEDEIEASVMMIHTFNKDREKVTAAVDIISKYVENICKNPTEEKYRKIKVSNKVFQEKVHSIEGSREFLQALGFMSVMLPVEGQEEEEEFLVLPEQDPDALELMKERRDHLRRGEPVRAQLDRQPQAFRPSPNAQRFELPPEFYNLTAEELKREQQLRSELVEKNAMLRTKAMREKEEQRERRKYNYTLLRVRLPDDNLLQGTFYAWDQLSVLFEFVRESLLDGWQPFELIAPGGQKLQESEKVSLVESNLVPAALLTFAWDAAVQADIAAAGGKIPTILKPELQENMQTLS